MTKHLNALLEKEMSRQEFLATLGLGLASVMGLSAVLHMLTGKSFSTQTSGYGSNTYGGRKNGV